MKYTITEIVPGVGHDHTTIVHHSVKFVDENDNTYHIIISSELNEDTLRAGIQTSIDKQKNLAAKKQTEKQYTDERIAPFIDMHFDLD